MYETDQEQIEAIKGWWNQNGNWVIGGCLVFIVSYIGLYLYQSSAQEHRIDGSQAYEQLLVNLTSETPDSEALDAQIGLLKGEYSDLGYGVMAALLEAKVAVDAGNFESALPALDWAAKNAEPALLTVILYRKAMVQYALNDLDAALTSLNAIRGDGHQTLTFELKGDILLDQGKPDEARSAYKAALDLSGDEGMDNPYLQIKLDDLAVAE